MRTLPPLHHTGAGPADDAAPLQRFLDSEAGVVLSGILHTLGALLFTAGLALYLYQARIVQAARQRDEAPSLRVLPLAHGLTLGGILLNGIGGLMRLYESDHPGLDELATSSWVQLLLAKHLFLALGVGLAVYLTYHTHWLATRDDAPKSFFPRANRIAAVAMASFGTILLATVLGAMAGNALLPPALLPGGDEEKPAQDGHTATTFVYANRSGTITGSPARPGRDESQWTLPSNATQMFVELGWTASPQVQMDVALVDPTGAAASPRRDARSGRVSLTLDDPAPGTWTIVVTSQQAVLEPYAIIARATLGPLPTIFERTYTVNPNPSGTGGVIVETNLRMAPGNRINFTWRVLDSPAKLDFNLHVHFGSNQVEYPVRGSWNSYSGNYTHVAGKGDGASLMWTNRESATPLRITCRIEGVFTFESEHVG